jgi:hypothetical protein
MNYIIGIILIICGLFTIGYFPQKEKIIYYTKREVRFEREGTKVTMNFPEGKYIERVEILYSDKDYLGNKNEVIEYPKEKSPLTKKEE